MPLENSNIPDDKFLVIEIKKGDANSFKKLYVKYFPQLIRFALYRTHSMNSSREAVQDLFTRIWIKRHLLNPDKSVKAYLYKSLNNLIINNKKLHSSGNISLDQINRNIKTSGPEDNELKLDIRTAIDKLPEKIKTVFLLSRSEGLKYNEIAEICNISEKAVEKRMSKAISIFRKIFSEKYFK